MEPTLLRIISTELQRRRKRRPLEHLVQKLQQMIDAAFGTQAERTPQQASDAFLERERVLTERAERIKALRKRRLEDDGSNRPPSVFVFEVVRHRGHWRTLHRNKHSTPFPDQAAAVLAAKELARKKRDQGHDVEVRLVRTDGQVVVQPVDEEEAG
jgi:predicted DNA-binding WGR domain protein